MRSSDPVILPMLSRGRHRSPRKGACFMELAGYLAGERWSDHPSCTHPLLARLARSVNDVTSDAARPRLAPLIPSVIGLTSDDARWDHSIALLAAAAALPLAGEERQRALAVGILTCDALLAAAEGSDRADTGRGITGPRDTAPAGTDPAEDETVARVRARGRAALADVPLAARWAERFTAVHGGGRITRHPGEAVVDFAVQAIAWSSRPQADDVLRGMLTEAIDVCRGLAGRSGERQPALAPWSWPTAVPVAAHA